jgi:hypothetical protein
MLNNKKASIPMQISNTALGDLKHDFLTSGIGNDRIAVELLYEIAHTALDGLTPKNTLHNSKKVR